MVKTHEKCHLTPGFASGLYHWLDMRLVQAITSSRLSVSSLRTRDDNTNLLALCDENEAYIIIVA